MQRREFIKLIGGAAVAWPAAAPAQQTGKIPLIGVLWHAASAEEEGPYLEAVRLGLTDLGYVEGHNLILENRFPNEMAERFRSMAAELVALKPAVLLAAGLGAAIAAKDATTTIPVVFIVVPDPIASNLVDNLARPGGNVTGLSNFAVQLCAKRLAFLKGAMPDLSRVALLVNPNAAISSNFPLRLSKREVSRT